MSKVKKIKTKIGSGIGFFFRHLVASIDFLVNNSIGLIFTRKPQKYNTKTTNPIWKKGKAVFCFLVVLVLLYNFDNVFNVTLKPLFVFVLNLFGGNKNVYQKTLAMYSKDFANGIRVTLRLSLIGTVLGLVIGLLFSYFITLKIEHNDNKLTVFFKRFSQGFVKLYVTVFRGTPMMVQAMILYYGVKSFLNWDYAIAALVTISLNTAAYLTEVLRGSINALDKGQNEAARSLGLSSWQATKSVIYPQAIKNAMPSIGNEFVINIKDSAVLTVIPNIVDLFRIAEYASGRFAEPVAAFVIAAGIYLFLTYTVTKTLRMIEAKLDIPSVELPSAN
ncbi:MAG: amino acid ABC transporter permease [Acholeplasmataceae bacterium]|jgi:putative lysine transport system permease protein|nr:amino acid ABC transporter permease [Acholeplasmataceae bacterium]